MSGQTSAQHLISHHAALQAAAAAVQEAERLGIAIVVAVVDRAGHTRCLLRMDGAFLHSAGIAEDKAYTAAGFGLATADWDKVTAGNANLASGLAARPRLVMFGGGLPIELDGECVGGIGVSGGSEEQDETCARAGLKALSN